MATPAEDLRNKAMGVNRQAQGRPAFDTDSGDYSSLRAQTAAPPAAPPTAPTAAVSSSPTSLMGAARQSMSNYASSQFNEAKAAAQAAAMEQIERGKQMAIARLEAARDDAKERALQLFTRKRRIQKAEEEAHAEEMIEMHKAEKKLASLHPHSSHHSITSLESKGGNLASKESKLAEAGSSFKLGGTRTFTKIAGHGIVIVSGFLIVTVGAVGVHDYLKVKGVIDPTKITKTIENLYSTCVFFVGVGVAIVVDQIFQFLVFLISRSRTASKGFMNFLMGFYCLLLGGSGGYILNRMIAIYKDLGDSGTAVSDIAKADSARKTVDEVEAFSLGLLGVGVGFIVGLIGQLLISFTPMAVEAKVICGFIIFVAIILIASAIVDGIFWGDLKKALSGASDADKAKLPKGAFITSIVVSIVGALIIVGAIVGIIFIP